VVDVAEAIDAKVIIVGTKSGRSARAIRKYFPNAEILAITNTEKTANHLVLTRGVRTLVVEGALSLHEFFNVAEKKAIELFGLVKGDCIIVTCGEEIFKEGTANTLKVVTIK
ncbi:MAG: pyruvate kinase alpha/beta domain-containing protein, partial [Fusobacteriaceae bacterium]